MKTNLSILLAAAALMSECVAPINLTYESARTLGKGQVDVQGNYSLYSAEGTSSNTNYGLKIGYGVSDNHTLKLRYERLNEAPRVQQTGLFGDFNRAKHSYDYIELENKFRFKNSNIALAIPIAYYSFGIFMIDPRMYFTIPNESNTFELSIIPKAHIFLGESIKVMPGLSLGFGLSSDLDRWALRPEIGYDGYLSVGAGLTFNLSSKKK